MTQWMPLIVTVLGGLFAAITPTVQAFVSQHPMLALLGSTVMAGVAHFFEPPVRKG